MPRSGSIPSQGAPGGAFSLKAETPLRVGKRFVEAGAVFRELAGLEDLPAVQTLDVLCVGILGYQLCSRMAAGSRVVHGTAPKLSHHNTGVVPGAGCTWQMKPTIFSP